MITSITSRRIGLHSLWLVYFLSFALLLLAGCAGPSLHLLVGPGPAPTDPISLPPLPAGVPAFLHVPGDYPTIQAAVDAALGRSS